MQNLDTLSEDSAGPTLGSPTAAELRALALHATTTEMSDTSFFSQHKVDSPEFYESRLQGAPRKTAP